MEAAFSAPGLWRGSRDNPSAFPCAAVGRNSMLYEYAESMSDQRCNLTAANGGTLFFGLRMVVSGLWSVTRVNFRPYK